MIPLFYKSHYEVIAHFIETEHAKGSPETKLAIETLAFKFAAYFKEDNANFNREIFLQACGMGDQ